MACFIIHIDYGLRTDGGIGEFIPKRSYYQDTPYYVLRFFYNLLYFIIVVVIMLSILFGIIIDTFAELREAERKVYYDKWNKCFICGATKEDLEKESINFNTHTKTTHSIWHYVEYIIGLKFVDPQETNAINSYVIEMLQEKSIAWFPSSKAGEDSGSEKEGGHHH